MADKLDRPHAFVPEEKVALKLLPNPLIQDAVTDVEVQAAFDTNGAFLKTADGLPLIDLTENRSLKWAVIGREGGKVVMLFQSDGAVVEEFKIHKLASMMAFDAGEYEWTPPAEK